MQDNQVTIKITTKGLAITADWLYGEGLIRKKTRDRIIWFYESGLDSDHPSVRKVWRKMMPAVYQMKAILDRRQLDAKD